MIEPPECRLADVAELCRKYRVKKFEVFGSDIDFLVDFLPMPPCEQYADENGQ